MFTFCIEATILVVLMYFSELIVGVIIPSRHSYKTNRKQELIYSVYFCLLGPGVVVVPNDCHVGACGFVPHSGIQVSKKQNISSLLIRKNSVL